MKIVMLLAKSTGGIGTHVDDLMRELRALGHEVVVATDRLTAESFGWDDAELVWPADRDGRGDPARPPAPTVRGRPLLARTRRPPWAADASGSCGCAGSSAPQMWSMPTVTRPARWQPWR